MIPAKEALERLREGNRRFVEGAPVDGLAEALRTMRAHADAGQKPFAVVLGCSDSRVPAELVFNQGLGDLFVIRVAGQIAAPSQIGSVEYAATSLGTRLVVVLGHSNCGAIQATLDELRQPAANRSPNLASIVERIRPAVEPLLTEEPGLDPDTLMRRAVRANVRVAAEQLRHGSPVLEQLLQNDCLTIVSADYSLDTGLVDFFDGV